MIKNIFLALDKKTATQFHECAKHTKEYPHDMGEMRKLRIELQALCGITELEAMNVLIYRNVSDYIHKYNSAIEITLPMIEDRTIMMETSEAVQITMFEQYIQ